MDAIGHDLRHAIRSLIRRPAFSALAVVTLAIGMGLNAVAFTAANAMFLKPHAGSHRPDAGWIFRTSKGDATGPLSIRDVEAVARGARSFSMVSAEGRVPLALGWNGQTEEVWSLLVTRNYFSVLDETPASGRTFGTDPGVDERAVLVSERFWKQRFGNAPLSGQMLTLNGVDFGIIGIVRVGHLGPGGIFDPDLWVPLESRFAMRLPANLEEQDHNWLTAFGRLASGATIASARGELTAIFRMAGPEKGAGGDFVRLADRHPEARSMRVFGFVGLASVGIVLLIACFNVAGLLLARSLERAREIAVRRALGAGSFRLVRQLLAENLVLAGAAGLLAVLVAFWSGALLGNFAIPAPIPQRLDLRPDLNVALYIAGLVVIAGLVPGLAPALQAMRVSVVPALKGESAGAGRPSKARNAFVMLQVAGSTMCLAVALLLVANFAAALSVDPGFEKNNALVMLVDPSLQGFSAADTRAVVNRYVESLETTPGIVAAGVGDRMSFYVGAPKVHRVASPASTCMGQDCPGAAAYKISPGYLEALGIPVIAGRGLTEQDGREVIVSAKLAADLWPGRSPLGEPLRLADTGETVEVIGVTADIKHRMMQEPPRAAIYLPLDDEDFRRSLTIIARTSGAPEALAPAARERWRALGTSLPLPSLQTMSQRLELPLWPMRTAAWFFGVCGALAVVLATVGLFGVITYAVTQRTREFGIRAAIGASSAVLRGLVMRDALRLAAPGVAAGAAVAYLVARAGGSRLSGIDADNPAIFVAVAALQLAVAAAACLLPARRAAKADPLVCLRT